MMKSSYRVYFATLAVFLGAGIISLAQRLLSVGLPDLRGALGLGFDEAAWIPTACDMALMFMGPFTVYLGGIVGPRRVLLICAPIYALASFTIPFTTSYFAIIGLQAIVGLSAGTFYPLSLSYALTNLPPKYTIYGIAAYSMELMTTLSLATPLQAWFGRHGSQRWIFWAGPALSLVMMLLIYVAMPSPPKRPPPKVKPSFVGFLYMSLGLSLILGLLEQGERLDWLHSRTIIAMLTSGVFLLVAAALRRVTKPNPLVNLGFLLRRNTLILGLGLFFFRFVLLSILVLIPGYLGAVQGYRPLETGRVLTWALLPIVLGGFAASRLMRRLDARMVAAFGFALIGASTVINARLTSVWAAEDFFIAQPVVGAGLAFTLVGIIGMIGQQLQETGAVGPSGVVRPANVLTYASFFQTVRLFGGQIGVSVVQRFVDVREMFHSNRLGYHLQPGDFTTDERLRALAAGLLPPSPGLDDAQGRAVALLGAQVRREAYTLAYADGFLLIAAGCIGVILCVSLMKPMKIYYDTTASGVTQ